MPAAAAAGGACAYLSVDATVINAEQDLGLDVQRMLVEVAKHWQCAWSWAQPGPSSGMDQHCNISHSSSCTESAILRLHLLSWGGGIWEHITERNVTLTVSKTHLTSPGPSSSLSSCQAGCVVSCCSSGSGCWCSMPPGPLLISRGRHMLPAYTWEGMAGRGFSHSQAHRMVRPWGHPCRQRGKRHNVWSRDRGGKLNRVPT